MFSKKKTNKIVVGKNRSTAHKTIEVLKIATIRNYYVLGFALLELLLLEGFEFFAGHSFLEEMTLWLFEKKSTLFI